MSRKIIGLSPASLRKRLTDLSRRMTSQVSCVTAGPQKGLSSDKQFLGYERTYLKSGFCGFNSTNPRWRGLTHKSLVRLRDESSSEREGTGGVYEFHTFREDRPEKLLRRSFSTSHLVHRKPFYLDVTLREGNSADDPPCPQTDHGSASFMWYRRTTP